MIINTKASTINEGTNMEIEEVISKINNAKIASPHFIEDEVDIDGLKEIETLDRDAHRWYTIATVVFSYSNGFIGVRGPVQLHSESMARFSELCHECEAFEMEAIPSTTYKRKAS